MRVALICQDKLGHLQARIETRAAHLAYIKETGVVEMAGPLLSPEGEMTGSLVVLDVPTLAQAHAWASADPYAKAGLFAAVTISEWKKVIG